MKNIVDGHPQAEWMKMLKEFQNEFITTSISLFIIYAKSKYFLWKLPMCLTGRPECVKALCQTCSSSIEG
jgi:hypothetical protein